MRPTRIIIHAALACALAITAVLPSAPPVARPDSPAPAAVTTTADTEGGDGCDRDDPYPVQKAVLSPLMVKPPCHNEGGGLVDGALPETAGSPGLARLTELRPRSHLPGGWAGGVDTRPA